MNRFREFRQFRLHTLASIGNVRSSFFSAIPCAEVVRLDVHQVRQPSPLSGHYSVKQGMAFLLQPIIAHHRFLLYPTIEVL